MKKLLLITAFFALIFTASAQNEMTPWDTVIKTHNDSVKTEYTFAIKTIDWKLNEQSIVIRGDYGYGIKGSSLTNAEFRGDISWTNIGVTYNKKTTNCKYDPVLFKAQCRLYFIYLITTIPK